MNDRIKKLRAQSLNAVPTLSAERAQLLTAFYKSGEAEKVSVPLSRAKAFKYLMENKTVCINDGELIVGERGEGPKSTPTYPEICIHSQKDLQLLNDREKISFKSDETVKRLFREEISPYWNGRSIRDHIFKEMDSEWIDAFNAGVFTEFMEQRAPGHTVLGDKIYKQGLSEIKEEIKAVITDLDFYSDPDAYNKKQELEAMLVAADGLIAFARRYAQKSLELSEKETDKIRKNELQTIAEVCNHVPEFSPRNFQEALQYYWFVHLGVITELNTWDSFNPGRLDQHLYPFYKQGIENGTLTKEDARELLQAFWIKFNNQPAPPKIGVTAQESNTYTDFCLINLGGVKEDGSDAVNELTYLILDVIEEMRILQPSSMIQVSKKNPDRFIQRALKIIKTGFGQPSVFNTDAIIQEMTNQGKSIIDARQGGAPGCVETGAFGKESYILTGYFNLAKILEITLHNGFDPRTGKQIGLKTGDPLNFTNYEDLFEAYAKQINHFVDIKIKGNIIIERLYAQYLPAPFMSIFIDDCIKKGKDYNDGGARYNTSYIQGVGLGTITDSLSAVKTHVYEKKDILMPQLLKALQADFKGYEEQRKKLLYETPRWGNDDDTADNIAKEVFELYFKAVDGRKNSKGGHFRINLLPTTSHVYFGSVIGATPDGRHAGQPLSEGISPVQGADRQGPTAVLKSAAKIDHLRTGGTLLNQKFSPQLLEEDDGIRKLTQLIRSYFRMDGHHIQFNVVTADTLRKARKTPENYRDLIVRVAGYSDYFVDLTPQLQEEIIRRTEHDAF